METEMVMVEARMKNGIQVLALKGRLTYDCIMEYKSLIKDRIEEANGYIIDITGIEQIDSTGLGLLVNIAKHLISNYNKMVIVNTNELIQELFEVSKLDKVFEITDSMNEAMTIVQDEDDTYWSRVSVY